MRYILLLLPLLFVSCKEECDIPAQSIEQRFNVQKCVDQVTDSVTVETTQKDFNSICDCQTYCDKTKEATNNSLILLQKTIDTSNDKFEVQQAINTKNYLLNYGPTCDCLSQ